MSYKFHDLEQYPACCYVPATQKKRPQHVAEAILHAKHFSKAPRSWLGNSSSNDYAAPAPTPDSLSKNRRTEREMNLR